MRFGGCARVARIRGGAVAVAREEGLGERTDDSTGVGYGGEEWPPPYSDMVRLSVMVPSLAPPTERREVVAEE